MKKVTLLLIGGLMLLSSCRVFYSNLMFRQKEYQYFEMTQTLVDEYVVQAGDEITLEVYSRDGFKLIDVLNQENQNRVRVNNQSYLVDQDGFVELPIIGEMYVSGYTEIELEGILEGKLSELFNNPFAILRVINRRVFLFMGAGGQIVTLNRAPTNLVEIIARGGGIGRNLKAYDIKIIRGDLKNPEIIEIDLSSIQGLRDANLIVQANDIVYVEPRRRVASTILAEIGPYLSLASTVITAITLYLTLGR